MSQGGFSELLSAIKRVMKARKMTYADLAKKLSVSETTIKRFFISEDASYSRLQQICQILEISLPDLLSLSHQPTETSFVLSIKQEQFFVDNSHYFAFFQEMIENGMDPKEIQKKHRLTARSLHKYLSQLEKMELLEWLPGDKVRLRHKGSHSFLTGGPLQKAHLESDNQAFLTYILVNHRKANHFITSSDRYIHPDTFAAFIAELKAMASSYRKKAYRDEIFYTKADLIKAKWLMGIAPYHQDVGNGIVNLHS